ncbi:hypothetical protein LOK49_LG08G01229 [Camellia lanceoleosa]|uniref:Uncharacterized protein n=1 Tax=Camellia lanceoleosa TaxID=1840588 RepID=A0ACC0GTY1_9ERIC|nr:hypothetical protein LOK49_LG08G01229 [Camellia lanceoleosa]
MVMDNHETEFACRHRRFTNLDYLILTRSKILKIIRVSMELFHGGSLPLLRKYPKCDCYCFGVLKTIRASWFSWMKRNGVQEDQRL